MQQIELVPDLSSCIQTLAKREHEAAVKKLLAADKPDQALVERAEVLRVFLETADLRSLRAESEKHLVEGLEVKFIISLEAGVTRHEMQVF